MLIESVQNPRIKNLLKLQQKSRERKLQQLFVVEGGKENQIASEAGYEAEAYYICETILQNTFPTGNKPVFNISKTVFEKIAYRGTTGGIIGVYRTRNHMLEEVKLPENPLIVILEAVEKPGNLGAALRTCDGAGVDLLIVCDSLTDIYNPNVIRSSIGTVFFNQIALGEKEDVLNWLKTNNIQIFSTFLREDSLNLYQADFRQPTALVFGTEAFGLSDFWGEHSDQLIKIPMYGKIDSLNVSNAAAICIYEAVRQRAQV
ncbi:MAG: RNA methyltransferase [Weeksellaceae bacterium]